MPGPLAVIAADRPHIVTARRDHTLIVFIEPECEVAARLSAGLKPTDHQIVGHPVGFVLGSLRPDRGPGHDVTTVRRVLNLLLDEPTDRARLASESSTMSHEAIARWQQLVLTHQQIAQGVRVDAAARETGFSSAIAYEHSLTSMFGLSALPTGSGFPWVG